MVAYVIVIPKTMCDKAVGSSHAHAIFFTVELYILVFQLLEIDA